MNIWQIRHPEYEKYYDDWIKWRDTYQSGKQFVKTYLYPFSSRETAADLEARYKVTYCPAFAKAAINEIRNSIFQRLADVTREGGTPSYQDAIDSNVDMLGSSMNFFMGTKVLPELLVMKRVGIYIDMPSLLGANGVVSLADQNKYRPYLYICQSEDVQCWSNDTYPRQNQYTNLLLKERLYLYDEITGLPTDIVEVMKHFRLLKTGQVEVTSYDTSEQIVETITLDINRIPFVMLELPHSLMEDIADYQISLLNLASSDIAYALRSNFPFYVEQFDPIAESPHLKNNESNETADLNTTSGRRYPLGTNQPAFIHPSSEPLIASMKKQEQLMSEIRQLVNLSVANMGTSAKTGFQAPTLEAGLSSIGLVLENAEKQIGEIWSLYEGSSGYNNNSKTAPTIKYPEKYNLKTDKERREDCQQLDDLMDSVPSETYKKEISKSISDILLRNKVSNNTLSIIDREIEQAKIVNVDPEIILKSVEQGLLGMDTASTTLGYPEGEVEKAKQDHADRLSRIAISQSEGAAAARGVGDLGPNATDADTEKQVSQGPSKEQDKVVKDKVRGKAKVFSSPEE